ncbi:uncharacterized protein [Typha latifolia]|uniref:uncharacterized protein isoform X1 n=1 Tax=Typha latifolia TaxID=4733 RepID=UPI003C2CC7D3
MAGTSRKSGRDRAMDFEGFLNDLQGWDKLYKDKDQKLSGQTPNISKTGSSQNAGKGHESKETLKRVPAVEIKKKTNVVSEVPAKSIDEKIDYLKYTGFLNEEKLPDAASEKDLGNEYFKQKKFSEAIDCYSRSIGLSPTAVAFANRAMAYLRLKRFEEAESDCTEALSLDDRYVKAYSRRATARKELGRFKASMEDSEFAMRLEPNNQELRKQYAETKALYQEELGKKVSASLKGSVPEIQRAGCSEMGSIDGTNSYSISSDARKTASVADRTSRKGNSIKVSDPPLIALKDTEKTLRANTESRGHVFDESKGGNLSFKDASVKENQCTTQKNELKASLQEVASRAAARVMASSAKNVCAPKSAYEFEVSWRAISDDCGQQAELLKTIPPNSLPQIFKNALSAPILIDIIKCTTRIFREETELAVSILDNLVKVPRFDMIIMCLSAMHQSELRRIWEEILAVKGLAAHQIEILTRLRPKYCYGEWQDHMAQSNGWPK